MDLELIKTVIKSPTKESISKLLEDQSTVFWIDWRQEDETIPESCELVLQTGKLSGELINVDTDDGYEIYVKFGDRRIKVPLSYSGDDRHITFAL